MEQKVKLSPKKLEAITVIQSQKAQLNQAMQQLNDKESLIVAMVMEDNDIKDVKSVKIDKDYLVFEIPEVKAKKAKKAEMQVAKAEK
jgi:hypothetical protein